jgi:aconitate hydratase
MQDSFQSQKELVLHNHVYQYCSLPAAEQAGLKNISKLPFSLKILLENLLRHEDGKTVKKEDIKAFEQWLVDKQSDHEIAYYPSRVLMQDFTGVPAVVDLAAMRDAMLKLKGDPKKINPLCRVDLVIDHSVQVEVFGSPDSFEKNVEIEMQRNHERYIFLKWGQKTYENFRVVPPGTGICHQVNLEYLAECVATQQAGKHTWAYPDTLVGTDSHTTMINGLGVLGWGVGGIEAEAAMLGQPISMLIPEVVGFRLTGELQEGITATDLVLTVTQMLRTKGVVGKFVEFFGPGLKFLSLADRATIANMAPEYGATCGIFPIDVETLRYLELSNRDSQSIALVEEYAKIQGLWHDEHQAEAVYSETLTLDLSTVIPSVAGPKRPQDRIALPEIRQAFRQFAEISSKGRNLDETFHTSDGSTLHHGAVVIAAITSCTNTSNPSVMMAAGLLARKAIKKGLQPKPWVKSSLAPGSKVVTDYLNRAGLMDDLEKIGFFLVGYGCTTCIGNSGPLPEPVSDAINHNNILVSAVLSGNRNFEGRIHPQVKANWLASPPLVVAFALAGTTQIDLSKDPLGHNEKGEPVYLHDVWPAQDEIVAAMTQVNRGLFSKEYAEVFHGDEEWRQIEVPNSETYHWKESSTYIKHPPFFESMGLKPDPAQDIKKAQILAILGDSVTTDHISPAGSIKADSPAGRYLTEQDIPTKDFNSYGARRGNHEVMMRGTFANIRLQNEMVPGVEGGFTKYFPGEEVLSIYDAAMKYKTENKPLIIFAGKEYGTGSSRDWAAKGTFLLGVKAVIAESFERIHRSNLIGMGVLPLRFKEGTDRKSLHLSGAETIDILGLEQGMRPKMEVQLRITYADGKTKEVPVDVRIDTQNELEYYLHGGILQYVLRKMI